MELHEITKLLNNKKMVSKLKRLLTEWDKSVFIRQGIETRKYRDSKKLNCRKNQ
jgi:hypothetical protein